VSLGQVMIIFVWLDHVSPDYFNLGPVMTI